MCSCSVLMLMLMCDIPKDKRDPTARIHMHRATRSCMLAATTAGPTKRATVRTLRRKKSCRSITRCSFPWLLVIQAA